MIVLNSLLVEIGEVSYSLHPFSKPVLLWVTFLSYLLHVKQMPYKSINDNINSISRLERLWVLLKSSSVSMVNLIPVLYITDRVVKWIRTPIWYTLPKEGDYLFEEVDELGAEHSDVAVWPAESIAHKAPYIRIFCRFVEVFDSHLGAREVVAQEFLFRHIQGSGGVNELFLDAIPNNSERYPLFQKVNPHIISVQPLLAFGWCRNVNTVQ